MKKLIIMIGLIKRTVLLMAVAFCSASAFAQGPWTSGGTTATLSGDTLTISGTGAMADYTDVTTAPWNGQTVTSVIIEAGVTSIGDYAFYGFTDLASVTFPTALTSIGEEAFRYCAALTSVDLSAAAVLETIGNRAFYMTGLTSVDLSATALTSIGSEVFAKCADLTSVTFPAALTSIGEYAFSNTGLMSVDLSGTGVTSIGSDAFAYCTALTSVDLSGTGVTSIEASTFANCTGLTNVNLSGTNVTSIGTRTFTDCIALESVDFPSTLQTIGQSAFQNCTALTSVDLSGTVLTSIGDSAAFYNCTALENVSFPDSLQTIGVRAFAYCTALTGVDLSETVLTSIGNFAFNGCTALESVDFPTTLQTIGAVAFQSCALVSVDLSGTVLTSIGDWGAFASCTALESVTFPDTLTSLGHNAFSGCTALTSVDLSGTGVSIIKMQTFSGCTSLTTVTFPATLTSIEGSAFNNCAALTSVTSLNSTPPALGSAVFTEIAPGCTLTVPAGAKALYEVADGWKDFGTILEVDVAILSVPWSTLHFGATSGTDSVLAVTSDIAWSASSSESWLTVTPASGSGNGQITVTAAVNTSVTARTATVTLSGTGVSDRIITVTQEAAVPPSPPSPTHTLSVAPSTLDFAAAGGSQTFAVTSNVYWMAADDASWLTVSPSSGTNNGTVTVTAVANTSTGSRTATVTVSGTEGVGDRTVSVTQAGVPPAILPSSVSLDQTAVTLKTDDTVQLSHTVLPSDATNKNVTWKSSAPAVATVSGGLVEALTPGSTTITVQTVEGGRTATCVVTVEERNVVVQPTPPADNQGVIGISLNIPTDETFEGSFIVTPPPGISLDPDRTELADELVDDYRLAMTQRIDGGWKLDIKPKSSLRSASSTTYRNVVNIAYTVDESLGDGRYEVKIQELEMTFSDNTVIREDEIKVYINNGTSGNVRLNQATVVTFFDGVLSVNSPSAEQIDIYSVSGALLYQAQKASGEATFRLNHLPKGVLIVKGGSGWVKKVVN